jgi:hypothetical protein
MSERIAACQELAGVVAELRALRDRWEASADTLLCLGAGRLEAPLELLRDIEEVMRRGTRVMGGAIDYPDARAAPAALENHDLAERKLGRRRTRVEVIHESTRPVHLTHTGQVGRDSDRVPPNDSIFPSL